MPVEVRGGVSVWVDYTLIPPTYNKPEPPDRVPNGYDIESKTVTGDDPHDECTRVDHFKLMTQIFGHFQVDVYEWVRRSSFWKGLGVALLAVGAVVLIVGTAGAAIPAIGMAAATSTALIAGGTGTALVGGGIAYNVGDYTTGGLITSYQADFSITTDKVQVGTDDDRGKPYRC